MRRFFVSTLPLTPRYAEPEVLATGLLGMGGGGAAGGGMAAGHSGAPMLRPDMLPAKITLLCLVACGPDQSWLALSTAARKSAAGGRVVAVRDNGTAAGA